MAAEVLDQSSYNNKVYS